MWPFDSPSPPADLIAQLASRDRTERTRAFQALVTHTDATTDDLLMLTLTNSADLPPEQVIAIVDLLGRRAPKDVVPALRPFLGDEEFAIRSATIKSLVRVASQDALDALLPLLRDDDLTIRQEIREAVINVFRDRSMGALIRAVPDNRDDPLYFEIVSLMEELDLFDTMRSNFALPDHDAKLFMFPTLAKFHRPEFVPLLLELIDLPNSSVGGQVRLALLEYSPAELRPAFVTMARRKPSAEMLRTLHECLLDRFETDKDTVLQFILRIEHDDTRVVAFERIARRLDATLFLPALDLMRDPHAKVRDLTLTTLCELFKSTRARITDPAEQNKTLLLSLVGEWQKKVLSHTLQEQQREFLGGWCRLLFAIDREQPQMIFPALKKLFTDAPEIALEMLGELPPPTQVQLLEQACSKEPGLGTLFVEQIYPHGTTETFILAVRLLPKLDTDAREKLLKLLTAKPGMFKLPPLLAHNDAAVRAQAVALVARMQKDALINHLNELVHDPAPEVRQKLVEVLPDSGLPQTVSLLEEMCADPSPIIASKALLALKGRLSEQRYTQLLTLATRSPSDELRTTALREIAKITQARYIQNFQRLPPHVRKLAGSAILKLDASFVDNVLTDLNSLDPDSRLRAAMILENLQSGPKVQQALLAGMRDPSRKVRAAIVKTLGVLGERAIFGELIAFLNDPDPRVRANTIEAIQALGDERAVQFLLPFLADDNNRVSANAAVALWKIGKVNVLPQLSRMLAGDEMKRSSALWALGEIGQANHVAMIVKHLRDRADIVRINAVRAISKINPEALKPMLTELRKDPSAEVKKIIAELSYKMI